MKWSMNIYMMRWKGREMEEFTNVQENAIDDKREKIKQKLLKVN